MLLKKQSNVLFWVILKFSTTVPDWRCQSVSAYYAVFHSHIATFTITTLETD